MSGSVIWLTGLSGAGKTTIARKMVELLKERDTLPLWLDGDMMRKVVNIANCGHDLQGRLDNAYRICRFAKLAADQGHIVIVSTMSLFHEVHEWNRKKLSRYFEVYIKADLATLHERDPKGLYKKFKEGTEENIPGMDIEPQFPQDANYVLENSFHSDDIQSLAEMILKSWHSETSGVR